MDIAIAEQGSYRVAPAFSVDEARGRAASHKGSVFGAITQLFARPKPDDVVVESLGLRYEPVWHATCAIHFAYDRRETYRLGVRTPEHVRELTIGGTRFPLATDHRDPAVELDAVAHCVRDLEKTLWVDGTSGDVVAARTLAPEALEPIELDGFALPEASVVAPTVRASAVVRLLLGTDVLPPEADAVHAATAEIGRLDLYFRPVYPFRITWTAKNRSSDIAVDGLSGDISAERGGLHPLLGKLLQKDTLFDIGSETLNLVLPGSAIPLRLVQALSRRTHH